MGDNTALVVDVSNLAYRSSYGHNTLYTSKGVFSGHVFGAVQSLCSILRNELKGLQVTCYFCYDGKGAKHERQKYCQAIRPIGLSMTLIRFLKFVRF